MLQNRRGNTNPGVTFLMLVILAVIFVLMWFAQKYGTWGVLKTILPVVAVIVGCIALLLIISVLLFSRRRRMLADDYGICLADEIPENFKDLSKDVLEYNTQFWVKEEGNLKVAVFTRHWSTGFSSGRREHSAPAFVADLSEVSEITGDDILALFGPDPDLRTSTKDGLFVVCTDNPHHPGFKPEKILVEVCELFKSKTNTGS